MYLEIRGFLKNMVIKKKWSKDGELGISWVRETLFTTLRSI